MITECLDTFTLRERSKTPTRGKFPERERERRQISVRWDRRSVFVVCFHGRDRPPKPTKNARPARGAGTRACSVPTHRDAFLASEADVLRECLSAAGSKFPFPFRHGIVAKALRQAPGFLFLVPAGPVTSGRRRRYISRLWQIQSPTPRPRRRPAPISACQECRRCWTPSGC